MSTQDIIEAAVSLPPAERLAVIERIWASLDGGDPLQIPDELGRELDERVARMEQDGLAGTPLEDVRRRVLGR